MLRYPEPTAEQVIQATEAAYLLHGQANIGNIANFMGLDISIPHQRQQVENSIQVGKMLGLLIPKGRANAYSFSPFVPLIVRGKDEDKRVLFRAHLDQFEPFTIFIDRLLIGIAPQEAVRQVCAVRQFADDHVAAWRAFESWGTYARSLVRAENGQYMPGPPTETLVVLRQTLTNLSGQDQDARQFILDQIGPEANAFIEGDVRDSLAHAMVMVANNNNVDRIILNLGNTYEDFLRRVGYRRVNLRNVHGIIQIGDQLRANRLIAQKHLGSIHLIGHIRNASDHGGDPDEGNRRWQISERTTHVMMGAVLSSVRSIALYRIRGEMQL